VRKLLFWGVILVFALTTPSAAFADAVLGMSAPGSVSNGASFVLDVIVAGVSDLHDFQLDLDFTPTVLHVTGVAEGPFLPGGGSTLFLPGTIDNAAGKVTFNTDTLESAAPGVSGTGILLEFDLTAVGTGTGSLSLANILLHDSTGNPISESSTGGSVTVISGSPVPTPEPGTLLLSAATFGLLALVVHSKRSSRVRKNSVQCVRGKSPGESRSRYGVRPQAWREF
jgi:hypothetical protein